MKTINDTILSLLGIYAKPILNGDYGIVISVRRRGEAVAIKTDRDSFYIYRDNRIDINMRVPSGYGGRWVVRLARCESDSLENIMRTIDWRIKNK